MTGWTSGEAELKKLLAARHLQPSTGSAVNGTACAAIHEAAQIIEAATKLLPHLGLFDA